MIFKNKLYAFPIYARRIHVVDGGRGWWPRVIPGRVHERAAGVGECVQRRSQAFRRPGGGGLRGARAPRQGLVVPTTVPEQRVHLLGAFQEQRPRHDPMEEQRPGQHRAAVHRQGRSLPGGQDIRIHGERHVQTAMGQEPDQLCRRMDQTRFRPEHTGQV